MAYSFSFSPGPSFMYPSREGNSASRPSSSGDSASAKKHKGKKKRRRKGGGGAKRGDGGKPSRASKSGSPSKAKPAGGHPAAAKRRAEAAERVKPAPDARRFKGFPLYPFQEKAVDTIDKGHSVVVAAPTGAGKTLIAEYAIEKALRENGRVVYTSPIKALSNQKYRDFTTAYPDLVGIMTGDVTINPGAPVLIMTTEIFRNTLFEDPKRLEDIQYVIFDEIHYLDDIDRGTVWEESLIFAPSSIGVIALSATISNLEEFATWIRAVRDRPLVLVQTLDRPVPLEHHLFSEEYGIQDLKRIRGALKSPPRKRSKTRFDIIDHLERERYMPALYFCFSRRACERRARENLHRNLLDAEEQVKIRAMFESLVDTFQVGHFKQLDSLRRLVYRGIAYHHAGMLPTFKEIIERLFTGGLLKLLFTTETFALGVNMPARAVVFESLRKFNGVSFVSLPTLDYYQMAGRAGRQGIDDRGYVFAGVNLKFDSYTSIRDTIYGEIEPVISRFNLAYSTILNLHSRLKDRIVEACEKSFAAVQRSESAWQESMSLLQAKLQVLRDAKYIGDDEELTEKGKVCALVNGFEIQLTEMYYAGIFEGLDVEKLVQLFVAIVYEPRGPDDRDERRSKSRLHRAAHGVIRDFQRLEKAHDIPYRIKSLDFDLSLAAKRWVHGATFEDLARVSDLGDGDLVRTFRLSIQLMRQLRKAIPEDHDFGSRLLEAARSINRDVVDAERQLNLGSSVAGA